MSWCARCIDVEHGLELAPRDDGMRVLMCAGCRTDPLAELKQADRKDPIRGGEGVGAGNRRTSVAG